MYSATRKVRSNGKTVVGEFSSAKRRQVQFESSLEEGLLYILNFDSDVKSFHDQPIQIKYKDGDGKERTYTPDYLVEYKNRKPVLFEVKKKEFLRKNRKELEPIFTAASEFASKLSWDFRIITDKQINTIYGENVRFLNKYQTYNSELAIINQVISTLSKTKKSTPKELLDRITPDSNQWPAYISAIWTLVMNKRICCNLFRKIHMETPIWIAGDFRELKYPYGL
jgi:hypothetical protein